MKMQIWKVHITEGFMAAIHGQSFQTYEGFVPDLKLVVNYGATFVDEDCSRYEEINPEEQLVITPKPELICEIELSRAQIEDAQTLASENSPTDRLRQLIAATLKDKSLDASDYEDTEDTKDTMLGAELLDEILPKGE